LKSYAFLFWAYNVVWAGIAVYLLLLFSRLRRVQRRLEDLEAAIERSRSRADAEP
jgi:CcmD family protein